MDELAESTFEQDVDVELEEQASDPAETDDAEEDTHGVVFVEPSLDERSPVPEEPIVPPGLAMKEFERLVHDHRPRLYSFVRRRIGNASDVEDIVQDTFVEAMKGLPRYKGTSRPETWIFGIAMNLVRNHYKRRRVRDVVDFEQDVESLPQEVDGDPASLCEHREILQRLALACGQLNADTLAVLERVLDDCLTYEEAALNLGIPVGTVRSRISRVRSQLRRMTE
ncbi:MAG TPA: RNA polymerase sigma factor [Albitalea sp.]|uniref:RNA polymerase sigma factor n=1 Tax=Piscinibacter sp. TaxID=1903157 RepID=UPI002ED024D5